MAGRIDLDELPPEVREKLGLSKPETKKTRRGSMSMDDVRSYALRALAVLAGLSRRERGRVIRHALKVNEV